MTSDIYSFGNRMLGALTNPTYQGNLDVAFENIPLTMALNSPEAFIPFTFPGINPINIRNSYTMAPIPFGLEMYSTLGDSTYFSDGTLRDFNIGLSMSNNINFGEIMRRYSINPALFMASIDIGNFKGIGGFGNIGNFGVLGNFGGKRTVVKGTAADEADKVDNSDKAVFERKIRLIQQCGKKSNTSYDDKIAKIKAEVKTDYKEGIKKLDAILKDISGADLYVATNKLYKEDHTARQNEAAEISKEWVTGIQGERGGNFKVDTTQVNKDNVLDVLGTFITGMTLKSAWKDLLANEDNFKSITEILYSKAEEMKKRVDASTAKEITAKVNQLKNSEEQYRPTNCYFLFKYLRNIQANNNDKNAAIRYGVPSNKVISQEYQVARNTYGNETDHYEKSLNISVKS